jgi:hypothetical protein
LALQAASEVIARFSDGVYFVDLSPTREPEAVLSTIARTIGIKESSDRITYHLVGIHNWGYSTWKRELPYIALNVNRPGDLVLDPTLE